MARDNLVHFVRHGQFVPDAESGDGPLTPVGRRQAQRIAARLREYAVTKLVSSDLQRAQETASIIATVVSVKSSAEPMLRESVTSRLRDQRVPLPVRRIGKARIDAAIARFLTNPPRSGDTVVVCHGNFIRALVCRTLQTPVTIWQRLVIFHCGITSFRFRDDGCLRLQCFNDTGHLPSELRTIM
jgi:broad specificity phosphatase PhoE